MIHKKKKSYCEVYLLFFFLTAYSKKSKILCELPRDLSDKQESRVTHNPTLPHPNAQTQKEICNRDFEI